MTNMSAILWCREHSASIRFESNGTVTVKVKWADFQQSTRSQSLVSPIETRATLHEASLGLVRSLFPPANGIRLVGVTLSNFSGAQAGEGDEPSLLDEARLGG